MTRIVQSKSSHFSESLSFEVFICQNLSNETLEHYGVKATETGSGLVFPVFSSSGQVIGVKSSSMVVAQVEGLEKRRVISRTIPRLGTVKLFS